MTDVDLIIIGAGAAGIGAAKRAAACGVSFKVIEASHRIGGRAYTEPFGPARQPFDLGCHWLHSASLNPLVAVADTLGFQYSKRGFDRRVRFSDDASGGDPTRFDAEWRAYFDKAFEDIEAAVAAGREASIADLTPREGRWRPAWDYIFSLISSQDPDQVSATDYLAYDDTGEDWAVREGYGALLAALAADVPVQLNTQATRIDWSGSGVVVETPRGALHARAAIVTVSTGILAAGDILFYPQLPPEKLEAVHQLPLGCHNRIGLAFAPNTFSDEEIGDFGILTSDPDDTPLTVRIKPFGYDYVVCATGGRHGAWLERAGVSASVDLALEKLTSLLGSKIAAALVATNVTAWRGDPWVRGAYSAAVPGGAGARAVLKQPLADRLFFAGEATHTRFYSTCHGAYMSGGDAVDAVMDRIAVRS